jgi:anti-anti-sigma factor
VRVTRTWGLDRTTEGVRVWGEIDLAVGEFTDQVIAAATRAARTDFVVDLSGVTFMDSTGWHALQELSETCPAWTSSSEHLRRSFPSSI